MKSIIGTWKITSFSIKSQDSSVFPFGKDVSGLLIYNKSGYMSGIISGEGRPNVSVPVTQGLPIEERIQIAKNFIAYAGKYRIQDNKIFHDIEVSFIPNLTTGSDHTVHFAINENRLAISSNLLLKNGDKASIIVTWKRIGPDM